jgi:D-alanyl-D-alanine carboxypeptidase
MSRSLPRRSLLKSSLGAVAFASSVRAATTVAVNLTPRTPPLPSLFDDSRAEGSEAFAALDRFIPAYLEAKNCPGLTLAVANDNGLIRAKGYGFSDVERQVPVTPDLLFEIGSITKSFVAITLLQLREEGKVDFNRPVLDYLPWLPIRCVYGPIATHHLLTHTSGLPDALGLFSGDPQSRLVQGFKPGEHFHYCNAGFDILGHLISKVDGRPWPVAVKQRVIAPLGMRNTFPVITNDSLAHRAKSYVQRFDDEADYQHSPLVPAANLVFSSAAGSITSTPGDMALYIQMLLRRGSGRNGRILSPDSFTLLSKPQIEAKEFSPTSSYGYGIGVDHIDGHLVLRHTGGMPSFISSIIVDLDAGVGAFSSMNVRHDFRPNPVSIYAVQLLVAQKEGKPLPKPPDLKDPKNVPDAVAYAKIYSSPNGKKIEAIADGNNLYLLIDGRKIALERAEGDVFLSSERPYSELAFQFSRASPPVTSGENDKTTSKPPYAELLWGSEWYTSADYKGARDFPQNPDFLRLTGHYRADSVWASGFKIVWVKGQLMVDGLTPLVPIGANLFRMGSESWSPETVEFLHFADGVPQLLRMSGADCWRVAEG